MLRSASAGARTAKPVTSYLIFSANSEIILGVHWSNFPSSFSIALNVIRCLHCSLRSSSGKQVPRKYILHLRMHRTKNFHVLERGWLGSNVQQSRSWFCQASRALGQYKLISIRKNGLRVT